MKNLRREGEVSFTVYDKEVPSDLLAMMMAHKRKWCVAKGFDSRAFFNADYIPELVRQAGQDDRARFFCLTLNDVPISFALGFLCHKTIYTSVVAHDPEYMHLSPGVLALVEAIQWSADQGLGEFSFMEGKEDFKTKYGNRRSTIVTYSFARTFKGLLAQVLLRLRHNVRVMGWLACLKRGRVR